MDKEISVKGLRQLVFQTLFAAFILFLLVLLVAHFFREPLKIWSADFVSRTGIYGVGVGTLMADSLHFFIPSDVFIMFAIAGELPDWSIIFAACVGSLIGGTLSYFQGRVILPMIPLGKRILHRVEHKFIPYVRKYGFGAVVIGALTPLPYSWVGVTVGALKMDYSVYALATLFRIPRFIFYFYAMKFGWMETLVFFSHHHFMA